MQETANNSLGFATIYNMAVPPRLVSGEMTSGPIATVVGLIQETEWSLKPERKISGIFDLKRYGEWL